MIAKNLITTVPEHEKPKRLRKWSPKRRPNAFKKKIKMMGALRTRPSTRALRPSDRGKIQLATKQDIGIRPFQMPVTSWQALKESCHSDLFCTATMKSASWPLMLSQVEGILTLPAWKAITSIPQSPINVVALSLQPALMADRTAHWVGFAAAPADGSTSTTDEDATPMTKWLTTGTWPLLPGATADL